MTNPKGRTTDLKTKPVPDGYETTFSSWDKGEHIVKVQYDGKEIPDSPLTVMVEKLDISKVTVKGLEKRKFSGEYFSLNLPRYYMFFGTLKCDKVKKILYSFVGNEILH